MKTSFFRLAAVLAIAGGLLFASLPVSLAHGHGGHWGGGHGGCGYGYGQDCPYYNNR